MTIEQLSKILNKAVEDGYGEADILFDTEARTFEYHMAKVGSAYMETDAFFDRPFLSLHEERQ
jgi:hypothetical protein